MTTHESHDGLLPPRLQPAPVPSGWTLEKVTHDAERYRQQWVKSACFQSLSAIVEKEILPTLNPSIDCCVCLGLGSVTGGRGSEMWELVALQSILEALGNSATEADP